jgi:hypothetical protein
MSAALAVQIKGLGFSVVIIDVALNRHAVAQRLLNILLTYRGGLEFGLAVANWLPGPGGVDEDNKQRRMNALP